MHTFGKYRLHVESNTTNRPIEWPTSEAKASVNLSTAVVLCSLSFFLYPSSPSLSFFCMCIVGRPVHTHTHTHTHHSNAIKQDSHTQVKEKEESRFGSQS